MGKRPYFQKTIVELEKLFETGGSEVLETLHDELEHRKTHRAIRLKMQVEQKSANTKRLREPATKIRGRTKKTLRPNVEQQFPRTSSEAEPVSVERITLESTGGVKPAPVQSPIPTPNFPDPPGPPSDVESARADHELGTDKEKEFTTRDADHILQSWIALEVLSPQTYRRPEDLTDSNRTKIADFTNGALPWEGGGEKSRPNTQLFYQLVLGSIDMDKATQALMEVFADRRSDRPRFNTSHSVLAAVTLDRNGRPVDDDFLTISSFAWGLPHALKKDLQTLGTWPDKERKLKRDLTSILKQLDEDENLLPLNKEMISTAFTRLVGKLGLDSSLVFEPTFTIRVYQWFAIRKHPEPLLMNSFFINDLTLARTKLKEGSVGDALKRFLGVIAPPKHIDLLENRDALKKLIRPALTPPGRWPCDHSLVLLQQAAINAVFARLPEQGVVGINGPPGTGKTTLLRDIVSNVIVQRAEVLIGFDDPADAFEHAGQMRMGQAFCNLYKIDDRIKGYEVLVSSSNNKAVENVSKELPGKSALPDDCLLDYFRTVSNELAETEDSTWGLIAAVLGNKSNRAAFRRAVWDNDETSLNRYFTAAAGNKVPQVTETVPETGEERERQPKIVEQEMPPLGHVEALKRWKKEKNKFAKILKSVRIVLAELDKGRKHIEVLELLRNKLESAEEAQVKAKEKLIVAAGRIKSTEALRARKQSQLDEAQQQMRIHRHLRPWLIARIFRTQRWQQWANNQDLLKQNTKNAWAQLNKVKELLASEQTAEMNFREQLAERLATVRKVQMQVTNSEAVVSELRRWTGKHVADEDFWNRGHEELQMDTPWLADHIQKQRSVVFESAIHLHKAFLDAAAKPLRHNLMALFSIFRGTGLGSVERDVLIPDLWSTLFLVTPVVSTTFASVDRMLGKLPPEYLGWLLIDEAGQAIPQAAVGAMLRSKRAVVVGDPLQIQPIVTLSPTLVNAICMDFNVDPDMWAPPTVSAQTLADQASEFGTSLEMERGSMWLGTPLLVHRRCEDPMFSIANRIAYGGNMVRATPKRSSAIREVLGDTVWVHVNGSGDTKWCPEEGNTVLSMLIQLHDAGLDAPDIFIISPFVIVSRGIRQLIAGQEFLKDWSSNPWNWANERIGTVHTFQGKEAEAVILVLGAPRHEQTGARQWAANSPNLLNVAATRAKSAFYVVGSRSLWKQHGCFAKLDHILP